MIKTANAQPEYLSVSPGPVPDDVTRDLPKDAMGNDAIESPIQGGGRISRKGFFTEAAWVAAQTRS